jgi:hypothetical protein
MSLFATRSSIVGLLLLGAALPACRVSASAGNGVQGDGVARTESRPVTAFDSIEIDGSAKLDYAVAPTPSLTIAGDENLLPLVTASVVGTKLVIHQAKSAHSKTPFVVTVRGPSVGRIETSGIAAVVASGLTGATFAFVSRGAADGELSGTVDAIDLRSEGVGTVHAAGLTAKQAHVVVDGAGAVEVNATDTLKAEVSGVGAVKYRGTPKIDKSVSGVGAVVPL